MKFLLIDTYKGNGHNQFNAIHIRSLKENGHVVEIVRPYNYMPPLLIELTDKAYKLPWWTLNKDINNLIGTLIDLLFEIVRLLYIRFFLCPNNYDRVVFLRYNILVTLFYFTRKPCYLIDHYSASELRNPIKRFIVSLYPKNFIHIALNDDIRDYVMSRLPSKEVKTVQHGLLNRFPNIDKCTIVNSNERFILCMAKSSCNQELLIQLVNSLDIIHFLKSRGISLIINSKLSLSDKGYIKNIKGYLSNEDYQYLITKSICVFLPYDKSFGYRVSGVFFECVANDKYVISTNIPTFSIYQKQNQPLSLVGTVDEFIKAVENAIEFNGEWDKTSFDPVQDWAKIIKE